MAIIDEPVRGAIGDLRFLQVPGVRGAQMQVRGELASPPIHHLIGLRPTQAGPGRATFTLPISDWLRNSFRTIDSGAFALLADAPLSMAIHTGLDAGQAVATSELNLSFVRPIGPGTSVVNGRASMVHVGREVGLSAVEITDGTGRTMGYGTTRCLINEVPVNPDLELPAPHVELGEGPDPWQRPVPETNFMDLTEAVDLEPMEVMQRQGEGRITAPVNELMGTTYVHAEPGVTEIAFRASPWFSAGAPNLYGGVTAWMAEQVMGGAVYSTLAPGEVYGTLDMNVRFTRPGPIDDSTITAKASVEHRGRRLRIVEAELFSASGKMLAMATASALVVPGGVQGLISGVDPEDVMRG